MSNAAASQPGWGAPAAAAKSASAAEPGERKFSNRNWIDLGVYAGLIAIAMLGFQPPFGGWWFLLATAGGMIVGLGAAVLGRLWRLNVLNTVLIGIAAYFILGTAFALPQSGFFAVLPTFQTLASLAIGAVFSWRDIITLQPPVEGPDQTLVLPYIATSLVALIGGMLVLRMLSKHERSIGRAAIVLIGPLVLLVLTMVTGTAEPFLGVLRGLAFGVVALVWLGWRRSIPNVASEEARKGLWRRRLAGTAVIAIGAGIVAGGAGAIAQPAVDSDRFVLRDEVTPPFEAFNYESPLAGFRQYTKELRDTVLFTVGGLEAGDSMRLAVLDSYTGKKWEIVDPNLGIEGAGTYNLAGRDVPQSSFLTSSTQRQIEVHVDGYDDLWLPTIGSPSRIDLLAGSVSERRSELRYNGQTGTGLMMGGLSAGDVYSVTASMQDLPLEGQLDNVPVANMQLPPSAPAPAALVETMQTFIQGETSPYLQLRAIEQAFTSQGYLSHGTASDMAPSRAGHGLDRMQELFDLRYMIGDGEQYASAMALMARELGYPARVVMGYTPDSVPQGGGTVDVHGDDVSAWVEVAFEGFGWVKFDPTPEQTDVPVNTVSEPQTKPRAQVRQPPQTEERPDELITAADRPEDDDDRPEPFSLPWWAIVLIIAGGIPIVLYLLPLLVFVLLRHLRRRRRHRGDPDARVAGAWDETVDRLAELGYAVPVRETRPRMASAMHPQLGAIATRADQAVFSDDEPNDDEIERVWDDADRLVRDARRESTFWRRQAARFRVRLGRRGAGGGRRGANEMTLARADLRNRALRSHGEELPSAEVIARIEATGQADGDEPEAGAPPRPDNPDAAPGGPGSGEERR